MSSVQLDGTHTPTKRGGESVGYQGRKKCKTSNMLILSDAQGIPLCCSEPIAGNHNDAYDLETVVNNLLCAIKSSTIPTDGLFLNADAGFDTKRLEHSASKMISLIILQRIRGMVMMMSIFLMKNYTNVDLSLKELMLG